MSRGEASALADALAAAPAAERAALLRAARALPEVASELKKRSNAHLRSDLRTALRLGRLAHRAGRASRDPLAKAIGDHALAQALHLLGRFAEALRHYDSAHAGYLELGRGLDAARVGQGQVGVLLNLGRHADAEAVGRAARARFLRADDQVGAAKVLVNLANLHHAQDRHRDAIRLLQRAQPAFAEAGERGLAAHVDLNLANSHSVLGRHDLAEQLYQRARDGYAELGWNEQTALVDYNLAYDLFLQGRVGKARTLLASARRAFRRAGSASNLALAAMDEAEMLIHLEQPAAAMAAAEEALRAFTTTPEPLQAARAALFAGCAARGAGEPERAAELLAESRRAYARAHHHVGRATVDLALAALPGASARDRFRLARGASHTFRELGLRDRAALCEVVLGGIEAERGRLTHARGHLDRALRSARRSGLTEVELRARHALGRLAETRGDRRRALSQYRGAIGAYERLRAGIDSDTDRLTFAAGRGDVLHDGLRAAIDQGRLDVAFELVERSRARTLVDLLGGDDRVVAACVSRTGSRTLARLKQELGRLDAGARSRERSGGAANAGEQRELRRIGAALDHAVSRLVVTRPDLSYDLVGRPVVDVDQTRAVLGPERTLIAYFGDAGRIGALIITPDRLEVVRDLAAADEVDRALGVLRFTLGSPAFLQEGSDPDDPARLAAATAPLEALHRLLIAPLEAAIADRHLVIVPFGRLHHVPFHALSRSGRPLLAEREVALAPSATALVRLAQRPPSAARGALVVAVPDADTPTLEIEARDVARLLDARLVAGAGATAEALAREARRSSVVHIAAHGRYEPSEPSLSGLELGDGRLLVPEVAGLRLDADLVTLSACETAAGAPRGDEVLGLVRAFLQAGARTLVASLWSVSDASTSELMTGFYGRLAEGDSVTAAMRRSVLALRESWPHPYHWAPFVVVGPGFPLYTRENHSKRRKRR